MSCSGRNSPSGSHQRWASWLNFSSSAGSAFINPDSRNKKPRRSGAFVEAGNRSVLARADDFDLGPAIGLQAGDQLLVAAVLAAHVLALASGYRLRLALALGVDAVRFQALRYQIGLD